MALGIDIYRYQTVTDWNAVKRHGVSFVYVKGTDGFGPAIVHADGQVRGAQSVGLPVGLYHYAQLGEPRRQANVLAAEVKRLGATGLPPVLDLEDPHAPGAAARQFTLDFLDELRDQGFARVCLYANTSMLTGIQAATLNVPGLVIWEANYNVNDGRRYGLPSRPWRRDVHQYTSVGTVPGITGRVDLNESLTDFIEGGDMPLTKADAQLVANEVWEMAKPHLDPNSGQPALPMWIWTVGGNMGGWAAANAALRIEALAKAIAEDQSNDLDEATAKTILETAIRTIPGPPQEVEVSPELLTNGLITAMHSLPDEAFDRFAQASADEADRRAAARANTKV